MSTVLTDKVKDKIMDYLADQCCQDMIYDFQYELLCDYIHNDGGLYDYIQDWLWEGIDFSKANEPGFTAKTGQRIISKMIIKETRQELSKCNRDLVREALKQWTIDFKDWIWKNNFTQTHSQKTSKIKNFKFRKLIKCLFRNRSFGTADWRKCQQRTRRIFRRWACRVVFGLR